MERDAKLAAVEVPPGLANALMEAAGKFVEFTLNAASPIERAAIASELENRTLEMQLGIGFFPDAAYITVAHKRGDVLHPMLVNIRPVEALHLDGSKVN